MNTYKNKNWTERDYEATNIIYVRAENAPTENWIEVEQEIPSDMIILYTSGNAEYYGYL